MYYPYQKGRYEVAPGLLPFTKDFGNGSWDQKLFQLGPDFLEFRKQLETNRKLEAHSKYVCFSETMVKPSIAKIVGFIAEKLAADYPAEIKVSQTGQVMTFESSFTHERLKINLEDGSLLEGKGSLKYETAWDALCSQVPEDLAVWKLNADGSEEIEALHLNAPNHWAAESKIGKSFAAVHEPVAHIDKIVPWAVRILQGIIDKGPYVRFAWGVGTDSRLNHHPVAAPGTLDDDWKGRRFREDQPELFVRVERQVLWGFPELNRALFTIRTYFQDVHDLAENNPDALRGLIAAIMSMSPESLVYKGLDQDRDKILKWLNQLLEPK